MAAAICWRLNSRIHPSTTSTANETFIPVSANGINEMLTLT
jgi:hypothetical protein